jgi:hypothetical protein
MEGTGPFLTIRISSYEKRIEQYFSVSAEANEGAVRVLWAPDPTKPRDSEKP